MTEFLPSRNDKIFNALFGNNTRVMDYGLWLFLAGLFFSIVILEIAAVIYILILFLIILRIKNLNLKIEDYLFLLFVLSWMISSIIAGEYNVLMYMIPICFVPISQQLWHKKTFDLEKWIHWIILFAIITASIGIIYHYLGRERTTGAYGGYFILATLMTMSIPLTISLFFEYPLKKGVWYLLMVFPQIMALWWSATRSAMLGLFLAFSIWAFHDVIKNRFARLARPGKTLSRWSLALFPLLLLLLLILTSDDPRMKPVSGDKTTQEKTVDITSGRSEIIRQAVSIIKTDWENGNFINIIFGYGPFSYQRLTRGQFSSWESDYLHALMEQGLFGLSLVIIIYYLFFKSVIRGLRIQNYRINALAVVGIITFIMSFFTLRITGWHSAAVFIIIYNFLIRSIAEVETNHTMRS